MVIIIIIITITIIIIIIIIIVIVIIIIIDSSRLVFVTIEKGDRVNVLKECTLKL